MVLAFGALAFVKPAGVLAVTDAEQRGDGEDALEPAVVTAWAAEVAADLAGVAGNGCNAAEAAPVLVDERYERVCGRSSSAAEKLAADFRGSFALFSSAFSFFSRFSSADSSVVAPGRFPASISS
ncbi:hypothetical protein GCM10010446_68940 [Streptomyces enissocaesilis]|uniref:Secreted protein n=1 Tax=Streptomyces enissocaesilis TaxID=332589 RepID=A0ABP6K904_9ACTN